MKKINWGMMPVQSFISGTMAAAIHESEAAKLLAVASRDVEKVTKFAEEYDIPHFYNNYHELLNNKEIDVVYIALPNHLHKEWCLHAINAGKHVLCEKPLALNAKDAEEIFAAAEKNNVVCMEGLMYLHHPVISELKSLISEIGSIQTINASYCAPISHSVQSPAGGAIRNLGCYPLSLSRLLLNSEPKVIAVSAQVDNASNNDYTTAVQLLFHDIPVSITVCAAAEFHWRYDIIGTQASIFMKSNPWFADKLNEIILLRNGEEEIIKVTSEKSLFTYQVDFLNDSILANNLRQNAGVTWAHSKGNADVLEQITGHFADN